MKTRIYNARILSMVENQEIFEGELHIENDRIIYVGPSITNATGFDLELDAKKDLLMPGFKNAHTHSGMTILRSLADDLPLDRWLNDVIFPIEARMTPEDIYEASRLAVLEYLSSGITACFDMYLTPESIAQSMDDMEFRCVQVGAMNNFSQSLELLERMYLELNRENSLQSYILGFHAEYTTSAELMEGLSRLAHKYEAPVFTHLAETEAEVRGCIDRYGMTPLAYMDSIGLFDYGGGIYHGIYLSREDMEIMKKRKLSIVTNPASNLKLASGVAPIEEYLNQDIPVAIGTDGPASNNCLDMFREMFLVTGLGKLSRMDASAIDALEVLKMATVNGALAMGLKDCDVLAAGRKADIIMLNLRQPNMQPLNNIAKNIVYSGSKQNVRMTMVNGRILYMDGEYRTPTPAEEIYAKVEHIKERLVN